MNYNFNGTITQNGKPISGGKIYLHRIKFSGYNDGSVIIIIYSSNQTPLTFGDLASWLKNKGFSKGIYLPIFSRPTNENNTIITFDGIMSNDGKTIILHEVQWHTGNVTNDVVTLNETDNAVTDMVIEM